MRRERYFYDEYKAIMQEVQEQVSTEEASLTEAEKLLKEEEMQCNIQKIFKKYKEQTEEQHREVDPQKLSAFEELKTEAIALAEQIGANVTISREEDWQAIIRFVTNMVVIGKGSPDIFRRILCRLITVADHIWIDVKNEELVQMEFWYELCQAEEAQ